MRIPHARVAPALALAALGAGLLATMAVAPTPPATPVVARLAAATTATFPNATWTDTVGPIALSSPTLATIDGTQAVVFASEDGELYVVNANTGANLPGWPQPVTLSGGAPTAIESSPTVAYLDGPSKPPTILIGAGSTYVKDQQGGLVAFRENGTVRFTFHTRDVFNEWTAGSGPAAPDGYDEGVFSTPAVGDVTGDGQPDIVFGAYDHNLYALTAKGKLVPGFPLDTEDTIWSSPTLAHVRGKASLEDIFIGGDATGGRGCYGGFVYDVSYANHRPVIKWQRCENQTIWSSPALGVVNSSGRLAVVVGTGFGEPPPYKSDSYKLFAFYADNGGTLAGWPVTTTGPTFGSPAIGPIGTSGATAVVDTSWCTACAASPGTSTVTAWSGSGAVLWAQQLRGAQDFSSPILADLAGTGDTDVIVGSATGLYPLDGVNGSFLYGTSSTVALNTCSMQNAPAVADVSGSGPGAGWHLFESCGGPQQEISTGRLIDYPLPAAPLAPPPWPMWRGPTDNGVAEGE